MTCKACQTPFENQQLYCHNCGAKVVTKRLTIKNIISDFVVLIWGWDNTYLRTLKTLALKPEVILKEYISGVRKKYMNPLSFFVLSASLYLLVINLLGDSFFELMNESNDIQINKYKELGVFKAEEIEGVKKGSIAFTKLFLKYYTIIMAILMPVFSFFTYIIFRKPYNYAEHILCNYYIYGFILYFSIAFTILAYTLHISELMYVPMLLVVLIYMYSFKRLYKLSFSQIILKLMLFLFIMIVSFIIIVILGSLLVALFLIINGKLT